MGNDEILRPVSADTHSVRRSINHASTRLYCTWNKKFTFGENKSKKEVKSYA